MGFIFGQKAKTQAQQQPAYTSLQIQTSTQGKAIPIVIGRARIGPNLIWYGDFYSKTITTSSSAAGGKGGGGSGSVSESTYVYFASVQLGLCEGPIRDIGKIYMDKAVNTISSLTGDGFPTLFTGTYLQSPWGYLATNHPGQALNYRGLAHLDIQTLHLGHTNNLYQFNIEVFGAFSDSVSGTADADPSLAIPYILSDPNCGAGFPAARIGDLTAYQNYTLASGLLISLSLDSQTAASQTLADIATATNSEFVWSSGLLTVVPYGDAAISGNGKTFTPNLAPLFDLTDDDFIVENPGDDPVLLNRARPADAINAVSLEFVDASNDYNTGLAQAKDQAAIDQYGLRPNTTSNTHLFADATATQVSVQLQMQRQAVRNRYTATVDERYILLDPMDLVTLTDSGLGLVRQLVRVLEIDENDDRSLTMQFEEVLGGTGSAALNSFQTNAGYSVNTNNAPGDVNVPAIFDAPVQIAATGLETWMAVSGGDDWGGCDVYISTDDETYKFADRIAGPSRQGTLSVSIPASADPDTIHTLSVDLTESVSDLISGTQDDADNGHTLCYVDGELIAYQTATLTAANKYDLTYLRRGMYGSAITGHAAGSAFARLDDAIFKYTYDKGQIGQTIYVKLLSFNIFGGGAQALTDVSPYTHTIGGPPDPPTVTNFLVQQNGNSVNFTWTQVLDYALAGYDIGYAPMGSTLWSQFNLLTEASKGTEMTNAAVPSGTWTFGIRARDIADQLSPGIATFDLVIENNNDTTTIQVQEPDWAGTMSGFIRHWTGVLIPDSATLMSAVTTYTDFDTFVLDPVASAYYITPTYDIGFENSLRIHSAYTLTEGPGQTGTPSADIQLDAWQTGADPGTYVDWTVGTIPVRYLNMKIIYAPVAGAVAYLSDFTYTVDRSPVIEQGQSEVIAPGGTTVTFPQPFHEVPFVTATPVATTALYASAGVPTVNDCVIHVWDHTGADVGGTVTWRATGF